MPGEVNQTRLAPFPPLRSCAPLGRKDPAQRLGSQCSTHPQTERRLQEVRCRPTPSHDLRLLSLATALLAFILISPACALACPACKDAIYSSSDPKGYTRLTKGYARSIYLLMGTPYLVFAGVTLTIVRSGYRYRKRYQAPLRSARRNKR